MKKGRDINRGREEREKKKGCCEEEDRERGSEESAGSGAMEGRKKHVDTETQPESKGFSFDIP